jgi:endonuclease/exonuclease/phosphatase family metal-dependent hydrolase
MGVHLLAHPDDRGRTARREVQARIAADIARREIADKGYRTVVMGDFNDFDPDVEGPEGFPRGDRNVLRLVKDFDPARKGPELFNAAGRIAAPAARFSAYWDKNRNGRREDREPVSLIDHILLDNALSRRLVKVDIPHAAHDGTTSDHWPVIVELAPARP